MIRLQHSGWGRSALLAAVCGALVWGCNGDDDENIVIDEKGLIGAGVLKAGTQDPSATVTIRREGTKVTDAVVTVNGAVLSLTTSAVYHAPSLPINAGDNVALEIVWPDATVSATLTMPEGPIVTAPTTAGGPYDASQDITVSWDALSPAPLEVEVGVAHICTASGDPWTLVVDGTLASAVIPGTTLNASATAFLYVAAVNRTSLLGSRAETGSSFIVGNITEVEEFSTQ